MFKEFKEFALRGNVMDMAVGIILGAAFGKIVSSLVADMIMPLVSLLTGGINFSGLFYNLSGTPYATLAEAQQAGAATLNYGMFLQTVLDFLIIAFSIFLAIKAMNRLARKKPQESPSTVPPRQEVLLEEIRDLLKK